MQSSKMKAKDGSTIELVDNRISDADITNWNGKLNVDGSNATPVGVTAMMRQVESGSADLNDDNSYFGDSNSDHTHIVRRPVLNLWNYIKGKISSVLGLTATNYSGKAATAGKAIADASGNNIETTYATKSELDAAAGSATAKKFTGYNTSNIVTGSWYIIALKNGGASEWERLYEFLICSNDNSSEQMRVLFSPRISAKGEFDGSKVFISGHINKNTSLLANWKFATLKDTAGTTYTALCVKGTNSNSSRSVYWNVRSVRGNNDWNPVSINLDTTTEYTIVSELPFNGANSLPNCITTDSVTLNTSGNEFNASLPITSGAMFGYLTNNACKPSKAITLSSGGNNITQTGGSWTSTWTQKDSKISGDGMLDVTANFGINIINQHTYVKKLTSGTCALCDWGGNVVDSANFIMPKHIDNTLVYTVTDNVSLRFVVRACASNFENGLKVVITLPSDYTIDEQVSISAFTLRGTYWRNGTGYNSNAITYDS